MNKVVLVNSAQKIPQVKKFLHLRGVNKYALIQNPEDLGLELMSASCDVFVFDFFMDLSIIQTITDMKEAINDLSVFVSSSDVGRAYASITQSVYVIPKTEDILLNFWDSDACGLNNTVLCELSSRAPVMLNLTRAYPVKTTKLKAVIKSQRINITIEDESGGTVHEGVSQLDFRVTPIGKEIKKSIAIRRQVDDYTVDVPEYMNYSIKTVNTDVIVENNPEYKNSILKELLKLVLTHRPKRVKSPATVKPVKPIKVVRVHPLDAEAEILSRLNGGKNPAEVQDVQIRSTSAAEEIKLANGHSEKFDTTGIAVDDIELPRSNQPKPYASEDTHHTDLDSTIPQQPSVVAALVVPKDNTESVILDTLIERQKALAQLEGERAARIEAIKDSETQIDRDALEISSKNIGSSHKKSRRLKIYRNASDYFTGENLLDTAQVQEIMNACNLSKSRGIPIQFEDYAMQKLLITPEQYLDFEAAVRRISVIYWEDLARSIVVTRNFSEEIYRDQRFLEIESQVNDFKSTIIASTKSKNLVSQLNRRLGDFTLIYTIDSYIDQKLEQGKCTK